MTSANSSGTAAAVKPVDMKFEVVVIGVSDVNRARDFYKSLGWRLDVDLDRGDFRGVQVTPPNSRASIIFGKGIAAPQPGALSSLLLAVDDINAARNELVARGIEVGEVFHFAGGPLNELGENPRIPGRDPEGRSYFSFASFKDPDGNGWLLQEITTRFPGREWEPAHADVATLASLLHETSEHHDSFEKAHAEHHWWDWYAPYLAARQNGSSPEESRAAADRYMEEVHHILPR
jgi:catechol 2,3-dioxygenase-like lactoylglutathione lyase family enzyme